MSDQFKKERINMGKRKEYPRILLHCVVLQHFLVFILSIKAPIVAHMLMLKSYLFLVWETHVMQ